MWSSFFLFTLLLTSCAVAGVAPRRAHLASHHRTRAMREQGCDAKPKTCLDELRDITVTPETMWWTSVFQIAFPQFNRNPPPYVVTPRNEHDVQRALKCLHQEGTRVSVKGGGHNYNGYSSPSPGGVQLNFKAHMRNMTDVSAEWGMPALRVEAGAIFNDVYTLLNASSNPLHGYLLAGGFCPTVGVAGFHLGGGIGALSKEFGMGIDNMLQVTMVTANGSAIVNASLTENSDLFWALRGGGASFGVVTHFVLKLHSEAALHDGGAPMYTYGEYCYDWSVDEIKAELGSFSNKFDAIPRWLTISWRLTKSTKTKGLCYLFYSLKGYTETNAELQKLVTTPLTVQLGDYPEGQETSGLGDNAIHPGSFVKNFTNFLTMEEANAAFKGYQEHFTFPLETQSCTIRRLNETGLVNRIVDYWAEHMPDPNTGGAVCYVQGMVLSGGVVETVAPNATAFPWRHSAYASDSECEFENERQQDEAVAFTRGWRDVLGESCLGGYLNFPSKDIENYAEAYWGVNLERLQRIRQVWNPSGESDILRFAQEVPGA